MSVPPSTSTSRLPALYTRYGADTIGGTTGTDNIQFLSGLEAHPQDELVYYGDFDFSCHITPYPQDANFEYVKYSPYVAGVNVYEDYNVFGSYPNISYVPRLYPYHIEFDPKIKTSKKIRFRFHWFLTMYDANTGDFENDYTGFDTPPSGDVVFRFAIQKLTSQTPLNAANVYNIPVTNTAVIKDTFIGGNIIHTSDWSNEIDVNFEEQTESFWSLIFCKDHSHLNPECNFKWGYYANSEQTFMQIAGIDIQYL